MISTTIGESRKFAALESDLHRLIYLMVFPWADKAGRVEADPIAIRSKCLMRLNVDSTSVQRWLNDAASTGLIRLYQARGIPILEFTDFLRFNTPHYKEPDSTLPGPECADPSPTPESNVEPTLSQRQANVEPTLAIREDKRREEKVREEKRITTSSTSRNAGDEAGLTATPPRVDYYPFIEAWNGNRGTLPAITTLNTKRKTALRSLVKEHGEAETLRYLTDAAQAVAHDDFWTDRQYGLDNLLTGNKLVARAEQWRNNHNAKRDALADYKEMGL